MHKSLLIELGTEELPAKRAKALSNMFAHSLEQQLVNESFGFEAIKVFSTPRRIAVLIQAVSETQPDKTIEKKGPALSVAIDKDGKPTPAGLGFARSCGVNFDQLENQEGENGSWLFCRYITSGKSLFEMAPQMVRQAIHELHPGKTMRWNASDIEFLRPLHWIVLMYGDQVISAELLNLTTSQHTYGHRFHHPEKLLITDANQYESLLEEKGFVIPSFEKRRSKIQEQLQEICAEYNAQLIPNEALLDEVTGLVERPRAYLATYAEDFLTLPKEVLVCAIEQHQKCFPIENQSGELLPYFITVSNIQSQDHSQVIVGNERVMRARLSDAAFFYHTDKKRTLESRVDDLKFITFQAGLGSLLDKALRITALAEWIGKEWELDELEISHIQRAALLAKADLSTDMVGEFPELQGIMGYYYALNDKEPLVVAKAIREHYLPRFLGDELSSTHVSCALGIADRMDNLVGIFSLGQIPSGDKDPFGLKRSAMAISRILIENNLSISMSQLIENAVQNYGTLIKSTDFIAALTTFMIERLRAWYLDKGISSDIFNAVIAIQNNEPLDIHDRIMAVEHFKQLPQAQALTAANKRVSNILEQAAFNGQSNKVSADPKLFETDAEKNLYQQIKQLEAVDHQQKQNYIHRLTEFASLQPCVDQFFDGVMVMVPDDNQRHNRLQLLAQLRSLFLQIADISVLQI